MPVYDHGRFVRLVREGDWDGIAELARDLTPHELADAFSLLSSIRASRVFTKLPEDIADGMFAHLDVVHQASLFERLPIERSRSLLAELSADERTRLLGSIDAEAARRLILLLEPTHRSEAKRLLAYPPHSVGRLMSTNFVSVHEKWTAKYALEHIRMVAHPKSHVEIVYVVDEDGTLIDDIDLPTLVRAEPDELVGDLIDRTFISLDAHEDRERAVRIFKRYDAIILPVVDRTGALLGIVTSDDVFDVAEAEATEDIHKSGSVRPLESGYRHAGVRTLYRARIGWLSALVIVSLVSSGVLSFFETVLAERIALVFFIPLLMATGGNTGAQSATLLVRAIATDDVKLWEWWKVFGKELLVGGALGLTLAFAAYVLGVFRSDATIGVVVGLTMLSIIILANLLGAILPFVLSRLKLDPAVASAPLITSITDALGLLIYFSFATWLIIV